MLDDFEQRLARLPEPIPPSTLAATVMARIAREPDPVTTIAGVPGPVLHTGYLADWLWTLVGILAVMGLTVHGWVTLGAPPDVLSPRIGRSAGVLMPITGSGMLLLALGLWLFLAGLFAPIRRDRSN